jgi:hypothetical protein
MLSILNEGFDHHDLEGILIPKVSVDEYESKMGENSDIVTITFIVKSEQASQDLCGWFEKGYDFVIDAKASEGELAPGKYLVFVEINRRRSVPERLIEMLEGLEPLSNMVLSDWTVVVDDEDYPADVDALKNVIITSPQEYRLQKENEGELNEMRQIAGLKNKPVYEPDEYIRSLKQIAGL